VNILPLPKTEVMVENNRQEFRVQFMAGTTPEKNALMSYEVLTSSEHVGLNIPPRDWLEGG